MVAKVRSWWSRFVGWLLAKPADRDQTAIDVLALETPATRQSEARSWTAMAVELRWKRFRIEPDGALEVELHDAAFAADEPPTQQSLSPEEQRRAAFYERRRIALSSSGGPVKPGGRVF